VLARSKFGRRTALARLYVLESHFVFKSPFFSKVFVSMWSAWAITCLFVLESPFLEWWYLCKTLHGQRGVFQNDVASSQSVTASIGASATINLPHLPHFSFASFCAQR
jgi:hypothetical protein